MLLIQYVLYHLLKDSKTFPLARGHQYTSVLSTEVFLTCYERRARLSSRAMAPSTKKKNSGLVLMDEYREIRSLSKQQETRLGKIA